MPEEIKDIKQEWERQAIENAQRFLVANGNYKQLPNGKGFYRVISDFDPIPVVEVNGKHFRITESDKRGVLSVFYPDRNWVEARKKHGIGSREEYCCGMYKCYELVRFLCIEDTVIEFFAIGGVERMFKLADAPKFMRDWFQGHREPGTYFTIKPD